MIADRKQSLSQSEGPPDLSSLFPLPLTPFEWFMLLDDRPQWPMTFCIQVVFRGQLDKSAFESAVQKSVVRHPLLRANVDFSQRVPRWIPIEGAVAKVEWRDPDDIADADQIAPLNLQEQTGLRVVATSGSDRSNVWFHFHHACCDGQGARRFIVDSVTGYAQAFESDRPHPGLDQLDYESLRRRHSFAANGGAAVAQTTLWQKLRDGYHFHVLTPRPLATSSNRVPGPNRILKYVFDVTTTARLREHARRIGTSLNDVGMACLFFSLAEWNQRHGNAPSHQRLRVMMPTDLRGIADDRMPAANRMSFSFVGRTIQQCQQPDFLAGIRSETRFIKQIRIGLDFLGGIALAQQVPGLIPLLMKIPRCMATALLTNIGDPTKRFRRRFPSQDGMTVLGNVLLDSMFGTPPIRPLTHAGVGMCLCSGKLHLSMLGNAEALGDDAAFFQSFVNQWGPYGADP